MGRILIADDHETLRRGLAQALTEAGHEIEEAPNGNAAIEKLHEGSFDVVVSDLRMGGSTGIDVLKTAKALHPTASVILMTAFGSVSTAVEAMKAGAFDYVQKPFEIEEMEVKIQKALDLRRMQHEIDYLRHTQGEIYNFDKIIGSSGALSSVLNVVKRVAKSNTTVLVRGETGTGKELIAGAVHHSSQRASRSFIKVNCAALQENLLESELFGHEKGAFTGADKQRIGRFEQADGGTLFLDEIGDMSPNTQAKILRVLQEHEFERLGGTRTLKVDVRLIAATNRDLPTMVDAGAFREDLFYRLNVVTIEMPPLRERKDDVAELAELLHPPLRRRAEEEDGRAVGGCAQAPDALSLAGQHPRTGERHRTGNAARRRHPDRRHRPAPGRDQYPRRAARQPDGGEDSAHRHPARGRGAAGADRGAEDVELGAERRGGAARDQSPGHELQDQDARYRLPARPPRRAGDVRNHHAGRPLAAVGPLQKGPRRAPAHRSKVLLTPRRDARTRQRGQNQRQRLHAHHGFDTVRRARGCARR